MHIIWKGYGIAVAVIGFLGFVLAQLATTAVTNDEAYYTDHPEPKLCGALLGAALAFGAVKLIERFYPPRIVIDKASGQEIVWHRGDSFFFIPIRFLPYAILVLGAAVALGPFISSKLK